MSNITGTYTLSFSSNGAESVRLNNIMGLSEEEIALAYSPENKSKLTYREHKDGSGYAVSVKSTLMKKMDGEWEFKFGEEKEIKVGSTSIHICLTRKSTNQVIEVIKSGDLVHTYKMDFSSLGVRLEHTATGHGRVSTAFWEREAAPIAGYYELESHENAEKAMAAANVKPADLKKLMSHLSTRMVDLGDGLWSMTETFGDGTKRTMEFRFGQEFDFNDEMIGVNGVHLVTMVGPGKVSYVMKDKKKGTTEVWEGSFCSEGMLWTTTKEGVAVKFYYRRLADVEGTWTKANSHNEEQFYKALGIPQELIPKMAADPSTTTVSHIGGGVWNCSTASKVFPMDDFTYRHGVETSIDFSGMQISFVINLNKDGYTEVKKVNGKTIKSVATIGPNFMNVVEELVDEPGMRMVATMVRV